MFQFLKWLLPVLILLGLGLPFGEVGIKATGVVLQAFGICVAVRQFLSKQTKLGVRTVFDRMKDRLRTLFQRRKSHHIASGGAMALAETTIAIIGGPRPGAGSPMQDQIDAVWRSIDSTRKLISDTADRLRVESTKSLEPLQRGIAHLSERIDELRAVGFAVLSMIQWAVFASIIDG